ncbi:MAG: 3,4-dihydroxy-2-butanone-4-phosphate synthase [Flavobacteriales bacterium]|jgi:3,4-dihydroxy 2-butanone 4-phosphate synthase/GTP cyclohydrolase II
MEKETPLRKLDTIESALEDVSAGKLIIVVDDEDRENEGDFIVAADRVTPETINFMSKYGRGLICVAVTDEVCNTLELDMMVSNNTDPHKTAFTVSVDLLGHGCTTGISAHDRAKTIKALVTPGFKPSDFARPGHIFPLRAKSGGVLRRTGHTEAAVDLARLAGLAPAGAIVEIMNDDGSMARLPQLMEIADQFGFKLISIRDLIAYRLSKETLIEKVAESDLDTLYGKFRVHGFKHTIEPNEYVALVMGSWAEGETVPVRVHSANMLGDIFNTLRGQQGSALDLALKKIAEEGRGVLVYINRMGNGNGLVDEISLLAGQSNVRQPSMDNRDFGIGAQILRAVGVRKMHLLTNHPDLRRAGLDAYNLEIVDCIPLH